MDRRAYSSPACSLHETSGIALKGVREPPAPDDGSRVLVDRLWPRGVSRECAALEEWLRDVAPSTALRKWFGHDPRRWAGFRARYLRELRGHTAALDRLRHRAACGRVTLLYGARDPRFNHAVVLAEAIRSPASLE